MLQPCHTEVRLVWNVPDLVKLGAIHPRRSDDDELGHGEARATRHGQVGRTGTGCFRGRRVDGDMRGGVRW